MVKLRARIHRPSPSMVVALFALLIALSGTAMAAKPLLDGSDVADESLTGADILNDSVTGNDVDEGTLALDDVATSGAYGDLAGTPNLATVATSGAYADLTGVPTLAADADKLDGLDSTQFFRGYELQSITMPFASTPFKGMVLPCPTGKSPIAGGAGVGGGDGFVALVASLPVVSDSLKGWLGSAREMGAGTTDNWTISIWVICANVS